LAPYRLLDYATNSNFVMVNRRMNKKKKMMSSIFDFCDHWNCQMHEMMVNKAKNEQCFDRFGQFFIHFIN
jgi:hypothetical protein